MVAPGIGPGQAEVVDRRIELVWRCSTCGYQRSGVTRPAGCSGCGAEADGLIGRTSVEWRLRLAPATAGATD
ncbi:MAG TPA: hypothetical protein VG245_10450 [Candidatus Dormibacteraeota bacterium]|jgi:hypothetical protein|nr:hypothetical protein [Candidatus Dormibacteraeota bacterium]